MTTRFRVLETSCIVSANCDNEYHYKDSFSVKPARPLWRQVAAYLGGIDENWNVPADAGPDICVHGVDGMPADMLALCWAAKDDGGDRLTYAQDLLRLPDSLLFSLYKGYGGFVKGNERWPQLAKDYYDLLNALPSAQLRVRPSTVIKRVLRSGFPTTLAPAIEQLEALD